MEILEFEKLWLSDVERAKSTLRSLDKEEAASLWMKIALNPSMKRAVLSQASDKEFVKFITTLFTKEK